MSTQDRYNANAGLARLKPFQRRSAEYIFRRFYEDKFTRRFLLADEVGLGKTVVARGVIAKAIAHLEKEGTPQIDIIYICSNQDIARQNLKRLNPTGEEIRSPLERITLLPRLPKGQMRRSGGVNFIAITPGTSLDPKSGGGRWEERVLIYHLLKEEWDLGLSAVNTLQLGCQPESFRSGIDSFWDYYDIDTGLKDQFIADIRKTSEAKRDFLRMCESFPRYDSNPSPEIKRTRYQIIGSLREKLARTCVRFLEPDLIILDEFQRFKSLLDDTSEQGELAHVLFNYSDENTKARVLLMSATPYKMYTIGTEGVEGEDHFRDFCATLKFLFNDETKMARTEELLKEFRSRIHHIDNEGDAIDTVKAKLEAELRTVISRTERLAVTPDRCGMLKEISMPARLDGFDVQAYLGLQEIARCLGQPDIVEFWKSAPFLLNFMDEYTLKEKFSEALEDKRKAEMIGEIAARSNSVFLDWRRVEDFEPIDVPNSRFRVVQSEFTESEAWRCLWIPPALPYYEPGGAFARFKEKGFTKSLIFSSWRVVPKTVSSLLSYEIERRMIKEFDVDGKYTAEARKARRPLLNFARSIEKDRLTGMPVLGLIYPCLYLSKSFDPMSEYLSKNFDLAEIDMLLSEFAKRIEEDFRRIAPVDEKDGAEDESWYWLAPLLLDRVYFPEETKKWWSDDRLAMKWKGENDGSSTDAGDSSNSAWEAHVIRARIASNGDVTEMGRLPADLFRVLAQMALSGLANSSFRALVRVSRNPAGLSENELRVRAASIAWSFRALFNVPENQGLIRSMNSQEPYWRRVLEYCCDGNIQSMLDEYAHILRDIESNIDDPPSLIVEKVHEAMLKGVSIRASSPRVDCIHQKSGKSEGGIKQEQFHARFAMRYGDETTEGNVVFRADSVRQAFNSPFWPFVLVTTAVGQEGLDFHPYCHSVVHWNLPANPVDMEQREGRVHRYKGHAVRKNVASKHGRELTLDNASDPWESLFEAAKLASNDPQGIKPYWVYPVEGGAVIERHVPILPMSRESERLPALRKSMAIYRMVFGQPRQDELVEYLQSILPPDRVEAELGKVSIDLSPIDNEVIE